MKRFNYLYSPKALFFYYLLALIIPNVLLCFTEHLSPVAAMVNLLLPLGIYLLLMSLTPNVGKAVWLFLPIAFLAAFQIVLLKLYGRSVIAVDMFLNLTSTNPGEASEVLVSIWPAVVAVIVLYLPALAMAVVLWRRKEFLPPTFLRRQRRHGILIASLGLGALAMCLGSGNAYSMRTELYPVNVFYNIGLAANHTYKLSERDVLSHDFSFDAKCTLPDTVSDIIVMVIGETSRADHWQLGGYQRPTNPCLSRRANLYFFPNTISESNTTHKSVPLMLSHLRAADYGDSIYRVKSVISAFKEAGYHTAFISNQRHNGSFIDFFGAEADTTLYLREPSSLNRPNATDLDLPEVMKGVIQASDTCRHRLIVVHTYGSHFNYHDRYPRSMARFTPDIPTEAVRANKASLINAYDNTILMTDSVISSLISQLENCPQCRSALIYASDHGEDIFDDSRNLFLHASPCPSFYQLHVPMMVWLSAGYTASEPAIAAALSGNCHRAVASNESFFDTAMQLGHVTTPRSALELSVASAAYRPAPRAYLNDHNHAVSLDRSGLDAIDLAQLHN